MGELRRTRLLTPALTTLLTASLLSACTAGDPLGTPPAQAGGTGTSWAPAPVHVDGLTSLASADPDGFRLHTAAGDRAFLPGMNLGSTTPLHQPGELAIAAADYRRWLAGMGAMGVRAVRVYTIHPPAFYDELAAYNRAHPRAPLYLVQGVYLPDESYVEPGGTLYDAAVDHAFAQELLDASAAVHGDLERDPAPGHASGTRPASAVPTPGSRTRPTPPAATSPPPRPPPPPSAGSPATSMHWRPPSARAASRCRWPSPTGRRPIR